MKPDVKSRNVKDWNCLQILVILTYERDHLENTDAIEIFLGIADFTGGDLTKLIEKKSLMK
jgi:hypothetical protein